MRAAVIGVFSISAWGSLLLCSVADSSSSSSSVSRNKAVTRRRQSTLFGVRSSLITAVDSNNNDCRVPSLKLKAFANDLPSLRTVTSRVLLNVRGGDEEEDEEYDDDDSEEEEYDVYDDESEEEEDDEEDMFSNFDLDGDDSDDFKEDKTFDRIAEAYHTTPPLTKAYLTSSFVVTALGAVLTNNEFPPILTLDWNKVFKSFQIWRPFTAFLNLGSFGPIGYPMTIHFVHQYMSSLERSSHNKPYDFWIMILFGMTSMVVGYPMMKLNSRFLGHNISTFLTYIWSRMYEGMDVGVFDFIHIKAEVLPWFMLAQVRTIKSKSLHYNKHIMAKLKNFSIFFQIQYISHSYLFCFCSLHNRHFYLRGNHQHWTSWG
jgi:lipid-A-disaccharide synthase-like uncharacterized protein